MLRRVITALALGGAAVAACGDAATPAPSSSSASAVPSGTPPAQVDERAGTALGIALGDSARKVRARLGPPQDEDQPVPGVGLPWVVAPPPRAGGFRALRFSDALVRTARPTGVYTISVWRRGVRTRGGVRLGDPLSTVRKRFPGFRCGIRNQNTEYVEYPYCTGRVGGHFVWFGEDPVASVTISSTRLG